MTTAYLLNKLPSATRSYRTEFTFDYASLKLFLQETSELVWMSNLPRTRKAETRGTDTIFGHYFHSLLLYIIAFLICFFFILYVFDFVTDCMCMLPTWIIMYLGNDLSPAQQLSFLSFIFVSTRQKHKNRCKYRHFKTFSQNNIMRCLCQSLSRTMKCVSHMCV